MKSKKGSRIECYETFVVLKNLFFITKNNLTGLSRLSWQTKTIKLQKTLLNVHRTGF